MTRLGLVVRLLLVKRLEMQGFKSFADRVSLEFGPGVTGVVGPNGAGKSNVTDAIRWVLGEQSPRVLRCGRMEDVIFNGSATRKPLGFVEVILTLDNQDGRLPVEFTEVALTRRLYRSGESEYLLNGAPARLRDITELLAGTGLGREGYSLIGQGRIDEILMSSPEARRSLFDEACGIGVHRARKKEALARLDDVAGRLERVSDVTAELEAQLAPLGEQASVARAFVAYRDELERLELWLESESLAKLRARARVCRERLEEARERASGLRQRQARLEEEIRTLRAAHGELGELLEQRQQQVAASEASLRQLVAQIQGLERTVADREREEALVREEKARLAERHARVAARLAELEAERVGRAGRLGQAQADQAQAAAAENAARASLGAARSALEEARALLAEIAGRAGAARFDLSAAEAEVRRLSGERASLEAEAAAAGEELTRVRSEVSALEKRLGEIGPLADEQERSLAALGTKEEALAGSLARLGQATEEERTAISAAETVRASLEAAAAAASVWSRSALAVAAARDRAGRGAGAGTWAEGLLGVLGEELEIDPAERVALEAALGRYADALVVRTEDDLRSLVGYLKAEGLGPVVVVPVDLVSRHLARYARRAGGDPVLADRVSCPDELRPVVDYLLADTVLAGDDLEAGRVVASGSARRAVTLDGTVVRAGGVVSLGARRGRGSNEAAAGELEAVLAGDTLERMRRVRELRDELKGRRAKLAALLSEREAAEKALAEVRNERSRLAARHQEIALERQDVSRRLESERRREAALRQKVETAARDLPEADRRLRDLESKRQQAAETVEELARREAELRAGLGGREAAVREAEEAAAAAQARAGELRVLVAALGEQEKASAAETQRLRDEATRLETDIARLEERLAALAGEREKAQAEIVPLRRTLAAATSAATERREGDLETWRKRRREVAEDLESRERELGQVRAETDELAERGLREETRLARLEAEEEMTVRRLRRDFGEDWEEKAARAAEASGGLSDEAAQARVEELRRVMSGLGVVNIGAIEEHRRLSERVDFLRGQAKDLGEARESLLKLIAEMDETMARRFEEGFLTVRRAFREKIAELFGGGQGDLVLTDRDNLLDSGIEILVEPPSKKMQGLALLSAGERALSALALLLSFLEAKPSPCVILDEIDAPLDDANVARFCTAVARMAARGETQFVIVTHNKTTMEISEALYGVTMGEDGVSRLVSVKLEEREELARRLDKEAG